jgi:hypothetical protein
METILDGNKINKANQLVNSLIANDNVQVKKVRKDKGLIEKANIENKVIIVEDNRQIICG